MKGGVYIDSEAAHLVTRQWAVVNVKRGSRKRFPKEGKQYFVEGKHME